MSRRRWIALALLASSVAPAIVVLSSGVWCPPGRGPLFGWIAVLVGLAAFVVSWSRAEWLGQLLRRKGVLAVVAVVAVFGVLATGAYVALFGFCVISVSGRGTVYYPLTLTGDVAGMVKVTGGRHEAVERYGGVPVNAAIARMPHGHLLVTTALLGLLYQAVLLTSVALLHLVCIGVGMSGEQDNPTGGFPVHPHSTDLTGTPRQEISRSVFISYNKKDVDWLHRLRAHLTIYERLQQVSIWDDTMVRPGADRREEIDRALTSSQMAVLLVSVDFLASDDEIAREQLLCIFDAAKTRGLIIGWILVRAASYEATELERFEPLCPADEPLNVLPAARQDQRLKEASQRIVSAVRGPR